MLRVTVELIPNGKEECSCTLGQMEIENIASDLLATGSYRIVMNEFDARGEAQSTTVRTTAVLDNVERDLIRPMQLTGMALSLVAPVKRTMHSSQDYETQGVVLSRDFI